MTDQEIFEGILRKDNKTFLFLYQKFQEKILRMVQKNNGNDEDARDIFQEGLIALWANISQGKFQVQQQAKISTYLYALCRNLWISKLRKRKIQYSIQDDLHEEIAAEVVEMETQFDPVGELEGQFRKLDAGCQKLLTLFYYQKSSMKEIGEVMGITEKTAKNNKYRCILKLRSIYEAENQKR